jgi:hypothetical protein
MCPQALIALSGVYGDCFLWPLPLDLLPPDEIGMEFDAALLVRIPSQTVF